MNVVSFVLALLAILSFLLAFLLIPSKRPLTALGLALIAAAWTLAVIWPRATIIIH